MQKLKRIIGDGLALGIPLALVFFLLLKIFKFSNEKITPIAHQLGIHGIFGELTLTILTIILLALITIILGLLMQVSFVSKLRNELEAVILRFFPALNELKVILNDKLGREDSAKTWKPVLLQQQEHYNFAFLIEESDQIGVFFILKGTSMLDGDTEILSKNSYSYQHVKADEMKKSVQRYGVGAISLIQNKQK